MSEFHSLSTKEKTEYIEVRHTGLYDPVFGDVMANPERMMIPKISTTTHIFLTVNIPTLVNENNISDIKRQIHFWTDVTNDSNFAPKVESSIKNIFNKHFNKAKLLYTINQDHLKLKKFNEEVKKRGIKRRILYYYYSYGLMECKDGEIVFGNASIPFKEFIDSCGGQTAFVFDCNKSGAFMNDIVKCSHLNDTYVFCSCSDREMLPNLGNLPTDFFTSIMLTPAKATLLWSSISYSCFETGSLRLLDMDFEKKVDDKTLSEVYNNINAIIKQTIESIAFDLLDRELFCRLFRTDLIVSKLFTSFVLAQKFFSFLNSSPISFPEIPNLSSHYLWHNFSMRIDNEILKINTKFINPIQDHYFLESCLTSWENTMRMSGSDVPFFAYVSCLSSLLENQLLYDRAITVLSRFMDLSSEYVVTTLYFSIVNNMIKLLKERTITEKLLFIILKLIVHEPGIKDLILNKGENFSLFKNKVIGAMDTLRNKAVFFALIANLIRENINVIRELGSLYFFHRILRFVNHINVNCAVWTLLAISQYFEVHRDESFTFELLQSINTLKGTPNELVLALLYTLTFCITGEPSVIQIDLLRYICGYSCSCYYPIRNQVLCACIRALVLCKGDSHEVVNLVHIAIDTMTQDADLTISNLSKMVKQNFNEGILEEKYSNVFDNFASSFYGESYFLIDENSVSSMQRVKKFDFKDGLQNSNFLNLKSVPKFETNFNYSHSSVIESNIVASYGFIFFGDSVGSLNIIKDSDSRKSISLSNQPMSYVQSYGNYILTIDQKGFFNALSFKESEFSLISSFKTDENESVCKRIFDVNTFSSRMLSFREDDSSFVPIFDISSDSLLRNLSFSGNVHKVKWSKYDSEIICACLGHKSSIIELHDLRDNRPLRCFDLGSPIIDFYSLKSSVPKYIAATTDGIIHVFDPTSSDHVTYSVTSEGENVYKFCYDFTTGASLLIHDAGAVYCDATFDSKHDASTLARSSQVRSVHLERKLCNILYGDNTLISFVISDITS